MDVRYVRFFAAQESRAYLHCARAQHEGRCCSATVGDAASRDHRHADGIHNLRQEGEQSRLLADVHPGEGSAMAAGFRPLGDDGIDAAYVTNTS